MRHAYAIVAALVAALANARELPPVDALATVPAPKAVAGYRDARVLAAHHEQALGLPTFVWPVAQPGFKAARDGRDARQGQDRHAQPVREVLLTVEFPVAARDAGVQRLARRRPAQAQQVVAGRALPLRGERRVQAGRLLAGRAREADVHARSPSTQSQST